MAQLAVAVPIIIFTALHGFTANGPVNALLAVFGYWSAVLVVFNLFPVLNMDGARAWPIVPLLWRRWRKRRVQPAPPKRVKRPGTVTKGPWQH